MDPVQLRDQASFMREMAESMAYAPQTAAALREAADIFEAQAARVERRPSCPSVAANWPQSRSVESD
jgi:hypothetical protein